MAPLTRNEILDILYRDNTAYMAKYLREGGNPNYIINGDTSLLYSTHSVEMTKLLVEAGADIYYSGPNKNSPFLTQAGASRHDILAYLLSLDPELIKDVDYSGETALHLCVRHAYEDSLKCAELLLAANPPVDINAKNKKGFTALDLAISSTNVATERIIKLLIDNGADRYTRNIPRGSENSIYSDKINEVNVMVNFPTNNTRTEYNFKRYYKNSPEIRGMLTNPQTRRPLRDTNFKRYKPRLVDLKEGGKKKTRKTYRHKTRKSARK